MNNPGANNLKRSKSSLILFLVSVVLLVIVGGYVGYGQRQTHKISSVTNSVTNQSSNSNQLFNKKNEDLATAETDANKNIYKDSICRYSVNLPSDWQADLNKIYAESLVETSDTDSIVTLMKSKTKEFIDETIKNQTGGDFFPEAVIRCYQSESNYLNNFWSDLKKMNPDLIIPNSLELSFTKLNDLKENKGDLLNDSLITETKSLNESQFGPNHFFLRELLGITYFCDAATRLNENILSVYFSKGCKDLDREDKDILSSIN